MQPNKRFYDVVIIGGGIYGCGLALHYAKKGQNIAVIEKEQDLLQRASLVNQARVHQGYHYPRSLVTAARSRVNYQQFLNKYWDCIDNSFIKLYAIPHRNTKVSSWQFQRFCREIGAPIQVASKNLKRHFNTNLIEEVFQVEEVAFDAAKLKNILKDEMAEYKIEVYYNTEAVEIKQTASSELEVLLRKNEAFIATKVINSTYAHINQILEQSDLPTLPIKYELTEMALIQMPDELVDLGVTIMDGPFFSVMPYPSKKLHSLSHVRYTPHTSWMSPHTKSTTAIKNIPASSTNYPYMIHDASRYMPQLSKALYKESIWETKAVLLQHEVDDGRPILYRKNYGLKNLDIVMGGKIDNIFDIITAIENTTS
jgi:glycine/D-amino acid oxidase-like deaminating enzyme